MLQLQLTETGTNRNPMTYTLGEASKATGISKTSIHRAIKAGRISATKGDSGSYIIDPSELHRVYPMARSDNSDGNGDMERTVTPKIPDETGVLRREVELLRERLVDKDAMIADLREDRDRWRVQAEKATLILTDQSARPAEPARTGGIRGFFRRLVG